MQSTSIALCGLLAAMALSPGDQQPTTIRADVNLVELHVRVTNSEGRTVPGLKKEAFHLWVDDVPHPITVFMGEDAPVTASIVVDNSASMASKRAEVIEAALAFARASNPKDEMFVVHFNQRPRLGLPANIPFTDDVKELERAISAFQLGGTTAIYDALLFAATQFKHAAYPVKVVLLITDGGDNSSQATLEEALDGAMQVGIAIYAIGAFDENDRDRRPALLTTLADQTGGEAFFPGAIPEVTRICVAIANDIRQQYTVGFNGAEDGSYHRLRVAVTDPAKGPLEVRTRVGYIANGGPRARARK
jgi:Ca-activated chloride channel homolog